MKRCLLIFFLFNYSFTYSQIVDTTQVKEIKNFQSDIDSLTKIILKLDKELQLLKKDLITGNKNSDDIMDLLLVDEEESMPEDQRSKKKRVDELLRALEQRPGVLRFHGGATASFQNGFQKENNFTNGVGSFDIYALTSFGQGTLLFFDIEAIGGNGINEFIPTFTGLNGDAGSQQDDEGIDQLNLLEAWGEFSIFNDLFTITAGKIDLTNYFDNNALANDETLQFLSNSFINSNALAISSNSPGIRLRTSILNRFYVQFGLVSADNSGTKLFQELYKIGGIGFRIFPESDWEANIRLYGYMHPNLNNETGLGISFDETIFGEYKIFARYGKNSDELANDFGISSAWSTGLSFIRQLGDQGINIGIAYGVTDPFNIDLYTEKQLEIYARYQLNKWVYVSPHVQFVWSAAGSSDNFSAFGIRTHFNF